MDPKDYEQDREKFLARVDWALCKRFPQHRGHKVAPVRQMGQDYLFICLACSEPGFPCHMLLSYLDVYG